MSIEQKDWIKDCAYSPDGKCIITASTDSKLRVWDAKAGKKELTLTDEKLLRWCVAWLRSEAEETTSGFNSCAYSPDGRYIVSAAGTALKIWDAKKGERVATLTGHTAAITDCVYSPEKTAEAKGRAVLNWYD